MCGAEGWRGWYPVDTLPAPDHLPNGTLVTDDSHPAGVPGSTVTALWNPNDDASGGPFHLDLFITDQAGAVQSTFFDNNLWRGGWFTPRQATLGTAAHLPQPVAAAWANPDQLDIFTGNAQRQVVSTLWRAVDGWHYWFTI
jgi:hypothetical protein